jgi:hypothetical protein
LNRRIERWELAVLAAILLVAALLRIGWPTLSEFKFSEARLQALVFELTQEGRLPLIGVPSSAGFDHSPISVYLYVPPYLFTTDPIPATIYGGLVNVAGVALVWWLSRRWPGGGRWAAPAAALLFAVSPWAVAFSRKIWQVAFVPLLALIFVGLVISDLVQGRRWHLAWALVAYALLVQIHPSALSLAPALLLWLLVFWRQVRLRPLVLGAVLGVLTAVPFLIHQVTQGWPVLEALSSLPAATWDLTTVSLAWEAITGRGIHSLAGEAYPLLRLVPQIGWFFNAIGWLAVGAGLWLAWRAMRSWRSDQRPARQAARIDFVLLIFLLVPVVFNLRQSLALHLHFFALLLPAAYLLVGRALQDLAGRVRARWFRPVVVGGLALLAILQVVALVLMARFVATHDTPGGFGMPLADYLAVADQTVAFTEETGAAEVLVVGQGTSIVVDEQPAIFDALLRGRADYRFVDGSGTALFPSHRAVALLAPQAGDGAQWYRAGDWPLHELGADYQLVDLDGSWPQEDMAPVTGARAFENGVELQGYRWHGEAGAGEWGRLWLLWQVLWLSPTDSHFSARLVAADGVPWGQQDTVGYPTDLRRKGDRVLSKFDIKYQVPRPLEESALEVGMYTYPDLVTVPVIDGAGNSVAATVVLGPLDVVP